MSDLPVMTTAQELHRKAIDTINWMISQRQRGLMSDDQFSVAATTLWSATAGLYPPATNMSEVLTELMSLCDQSKQRVRHSFCNTSGEIVTLNWTIGFSYFMIIKRLMGEIIASKKIERETPELALEAMNDMSAALVKKDWTLL